MNSLIPQYKVKDVANFNNKHFTPDPLAPEALQEPEIFYSSLPEMPYNPWDLNRVTIVETKIRQLNDQLIETTPERRTAGSSVSKSKHNQVPNHQTQSLNPESIGNDQTHSTSISEISTLISSNTRKTHPPPEPKEHVSNLAKIIADKKAERAAQSSSSVSTSLDRSKTISSN